MLRTATIERKTKETSISLSLTIDGHGEGKISTGIGFFDHMLEGFTKHGFFDLQLSAQGDLYVDAHHTVEDTGIVLGQAIKEAIGDKKGIRRYGHFLLPMDETLVLCAIDLCGRPYFQFDLELPAAKVGNFDTELVKEFFYAVCSKSEMNLHFKLLSGSNTHHIIEASFKAFAKALDMATSIDERNPGVLSTKGSL